MRSEDELGRGAFGAVYRMRHRKKGTVMAVKVSCHTSSDSGRGRDGLLRVHSYNEDTSLIRTHFLSQKIVSCIRFSP